MVLVKKRTGELVPFEQSKIELSLTHAGASKQLISEILSELEPTLYEGIPTKKIYATVFTLLKKKQHTVASKFGLKEAIVRLGPKGYNFETFMSAILEEKGYKTQLRTILQGKCVTHEVDVIAERGNEKYLVECKFHNQAWFSCSIQTALYTYARFLDVSANKETGISQVMLATNTKFSLDVVKYAKCIRMHLLGWKYPTNAGLETIVDRKSIYPVTVLQSVDTSIIDYLLTNGIVLVKDLYGIEEERLKNLRISPNKIKLLKEEAKQLL